MDTGAGVERLLALGAAREHAVDALPPDAVRRLEPVHRAVVKLKVKAAEESDDPEAAAGLFLEAARTAREMLRDAALALACHEKLLARLPAHPETLALLEDLASSDPDAAVRARAFELLEPHLRGPEEARRLVSVLEAQSASAGGPEASAALLRRVAQVWDEVLDEPEHAFLAAGRALREWPEDADALALCLVLAPRASAEEELVLLLSDVAPRAKRPGVRAELLRALGRAQAATGDGRAAAQSYRALLELVPKDAEAQAQLESLLSSEELLKERLALLARELNHATDALEQGELLMQMASLQESSGDLAGAVDSLRDAFRIQPGEAVLKPLERVLERLMRYQEQAEVLARLAMLADGEARREVLTRRAEALERAADLEGAVSAYEAILEGWPDAGAAVTGLERLVANDAGPTRAKHLLEAVYRRSGSVPRLLSVLKLQLKRATGERQVQLLLEVARLEESHGSPKAALEAALSAFRLSPDNAAARELSLRLGSAVEDEAAVVEAFQAVGGPGLPESVALELKERVAVLLEGRLGRPAEAAAVWEELAARAPHRPEPLTALTRLYQVLSLPQPLARTLERKVALEREPRSKAELFRQVAALASGQLDDHALAIRAHEQVAHLDPADVESLAALEALYERAGNAPQLARVLASRAERAKDRGDREAQSAFLLRLGRLQREKLSDYAAAAATFQAALSVQPDHPEALEGLEGIVLAEEAPSQVRREAAGAAALVLKDVKRRVRILEMHAAVERDPKARGQLLLQAAELWGELPYEPEGGFLAAARCLRERPEEPKALELAVSFAGEAGLDEELQSLLEEVGPRAALPEARAGLARAAAQVQERLDQTEAAAESWRTVLSLRPRDAEALEALDRLYERLGRHVERIRLLSPQLPRVTEVAARVALKRSLAGAHEALGELEPAVVLLESAVAEKEDPALLRDLERLLGALGRHLEQARVLERRAQVDPAFQGDGGQELLLQRAELLGRAGRAGAAADVYAQVLKKWGDLAPAVEGLEALIARPGLRERVASILEPVYRRSGETRKLARVLEARVKVLQGDARRECLRELAELRESLGELTSAWTARVTAFRESPDDPAGRSALERLAIELGAFAPLAQEYREQVAKEGGEPWRVEVGKKLAELEETEFGNGAGAVAAWEQVRARAPGDAEAARALARLYRAQGRLSDFARVRLEEIERAAVPERAREQLLELAALAEDQLKDWPLVTELCRKLLAGQPDDKAALQRLERALSAQGRWPEAAEALEALVGLAEREDSGAEALELKARLARLKQGPLGDWEGALSLLAGVLDRDHAHPPAVRVLEELVGRDGPWLPRAAAILEPVYVLQGNELGQARLLEARVRAEDPLAQNVALLHQAFELYAGPLKDPRAAFLAASRALKLAPDDARSLELCMQRVEEARAAPELARLAQELAPAASTAAARVSLWRTAARLEDRSGKSAQAAGIWERVLELQPEDAEALSALERLYGQLRRWPELLQVLEQQVKGADEPVKRSALLERIGDLQEERLSDLRAASETFQRLFELDPGDASTLQRLDRLLERQGRWAELADVLRRRILLEPQDAARLKVRLARVLELKLHDVPAALALCVELLVEQPDQPDALARLAERVAEDPKDVRALDALIQAHRRSGDRAHLAEALEARLKTVDGKDASKELLLELSSVREELRDKAGAFAAAAEAARDHASDLAVRARVFWLAGEASTWGALAELVEEQSTKSPPPDRAGELCLALGQVYETRLKAPELAARAYRRAQAVEPAVSQRALEALDLLWTRVEAWKELAAVLEEIAGQDPERDNRTAALFRLSTVALERLDDPGRAAAALHRVLELDPGHLEATLRLEQLYEETGQHEERASVLGHRAAQVKGREREPWLLKQAQVTDQHLHDASRALALGRTCLEESPGSDAAFAFVDALLGRMGLQREQAELLDDRLEHTLDPREVLALHLRLGELHRDALKEPEKAAAHFEAVLERDPRSAAALTALKGLYEALRRDEPLARVLERLTAEAPSRALILAWAEVLGRLERYGQACEVARPLLSEGSPSFEELDALVQLFRKARAVELEARAKCIRADLVLSGGDAPGAVQIWLDVAELWRGADRPMEGAFALERVLEVDPAHAGAYRQAEQLYREQGAWAPYAALLQRGLPYLPSDAERLRSLRQLASVQEEQLLLPEEAFRSLARAVRLAPDDAGLRGDAERLADATELHEELAAAYQEIVEGVSRGPLARQLYFSLSRLEDEALNDVHAAEAALRRVLDFEPTDREALEKLADLYARRGMHRAQVHALEQALEVARDKAERTALLLRIAGVLDTSLHDAPQAMAALARALELTPDARTARALLALQAREGRWKPAAETLGTLRSLASTDLERAGVEEELAELHETRLLNDEAAIAAHRRALALVPGKREALAALERIFVRLDRPRELHGLFEEALTTAEDGRERVATLLKLAALEETRLGAPADADRHLTEALDLDARNQDALISLARIRRADKRWPALLEALERRIDAAEDPVAKAELRVEVGQVQLKELADPAAAAESFHTALRLDGRSASALHAIGQWHLSRREFADAIGFFGREAELVDGPTAAELFYQIGTVQERELESPHAARASYARARRSDFRHLPALRALKALHEAAEDWEAYEEVLEEEVELSGIGPERAAPLLELARHLQERRGEEELAVSAYERALEASPDCFLAARALSEIFLAREDWAQAERTLAIVARKLEEDLSLQRDRTLARELCAELRRLAGASERLGHLVEALAAYDRAVQADSTSVEAWEGKARLLVLSRRPEDALRAYQNLLVLHGYSPGVVEVHVRMGELWAGLSSPEKGRQHLEKALAINPKHEGALTALMKVADASRDDELSLKVRQRLAQLLQGEPLFQVCTELGIRAREKGDLATAMEAFGHALEVKPDALPVLESLYLACRSAGRMQKAAEVLERMVVIPELRADVQRCEGLYLTLGRMAASELLNVDRAVAAFQGALELNPESEAAQLALEQVLSTHRRFERLEEHYSWMVDTLSGHERTHAIRMRYLSKLGELRHTVLNRPEAAREAYALAAAGCPDDPVVQELFGDLARASAAHQDAAIEAYRRALARTERLPKVCSSLLQLLVRKGDLDSAFLLAQVMESFVGRLSQPERAAFAGVKVGTPSPVASRSLNTETWAKLLHPDLKGSVGEIFALLARQMASKLALGHKAYATHPRKHRVDAELLPETQVRILRYVPRLLAVDGVELLSPYFMAMREPAGARAAHPPDADVGIQPCLTDPLSLKAGGRFFSQEREVRTAMLACGFASLRPELLLGRALPQQTLELLLQAVLTLAAGPGSAPQAPAALKRQRRVFEKGLDAPSLDRLVRLARAYASEKGSGRVAEDVRRHQEAAELTALRAALLVIGKPAALKKLLLTHGEDFPHAPDSLKVREIIQFAASPELSALRAFTGLKLEP